MKIDKARMSLDSHRAILAGQLTQDFGENKNQNHSNEQPWLLSGTSDTCITNNTNSETSSETSKTDRETGTELDETSEEGSLLSEIVGDQDGNDQTVNGNNTSHNDGNNVCTNMSASGHTPTACFEQKACTVGHQAHHQCADERLQIAREIGKD